ncbi:MAG: hypothetical protein AABY32_04525 [Nanoarchaeota archaeon]
MEESTPENVLKLLDLARISLSSGEKDIFKPEFKEFFGSLGEGYDFVDAVWKFSSKILPVKAYPDDEQGNYCRDLARDEKFQENIIKTGFAKKLREGTSLRDLVKESCAPHINTNP